MTLTIQKAILAGQKEFKGIKLPEKQTDGTDYQIISYAYKQSVKFQEDNKENL